MQYIKITLPVADEDIRDICVAQLAEIGFEGFEETETALIAFVSEEDLDEAGLEEIVAAYEIEYTREVVPQQNWNSQWEENFQPVIVSDFCTVRADFHHLTVTTPYEIVITPKMSFGTGHHATTQLVMMQMRQLDFKNKSVLDFGTGTGILAVLAEMLGATNVTAIDNDEWSYENALENVARNKCSKIQVQQSSLEAVTANKFDIILANINRHILLQYMSSLFNQLNDGGDIIMSGLLLADKDIILSAATETGFKLTDESEINGWIALCFKR